MGWQFAAAEFVGGPIMIVLLAIAGGFLFRRELVEKARERVRARAVVTGHEHHMVTEDDTELQRRPWGEKLRSKAGWADAASYTMADLTMLRRELVIGYAVAGVLAVEVPVHVWNDVFIHGHGFWTSLENVVVGPFIAFISFVCSIGNVPMAAALWHGGISFGGVISFIFAAGLDVYEREPEVHPRLLAAPRTVLLPHVGSASVATRTRMARVAAEGVRAVLAGERPPNVVNPAAL